MLVKAFEMEAVEIGEGSASMAKNKKLTIEDYLDFIKNRDHQLNDNQLRKIISIHGFRGIELQKSILLDAVKTINLMDLRRSTLKDGSVSGDACLALTSVIKDLNDLQWQECHVTSLISQGPAATVPVNRKKSKGLGRKAVKADADDSITGTIDVGSSTTAVKLKRLEDIGMNPVEVAVDDSIIPTTGTNVAAGSTTVPEKYDSTTGTTAAAGSTTVTQKGEKSRGLGKKPIELAANGSIIPTTGTTVAAGSTTVSEKGKKSKGLGTKSVEVAADDSIISTSSATDPVKRKNSKGHEKKPVEDAADDSTISTKCTTVAAGGTTVAAKRKRVNKAACGCNCC